jgi:hypothetical protein
LALRAFFGNEAKVDFIERYLGFSPDHGDGRLEAMVLIALLTIDGLLPQTL